MDIIVYIIAVDVTLANGGRGRSLGVGRSSPWEATRKRESIGGQVGAKDAGCLRQEGHSGDRQAMDREPHCQRGAQKSRQSQTSQSGSMVTHRFIMWPANPSSRQLRFFAVFGGCLLEPLGSPSCSRGDWQGLDAGKRGETKGRGHKPRRLGFVPAPCSPCLGERPSPGPSTRAVATVAHRGAKGTEARDVPGTFRTSFVAWCLRVRLLTTAAALDVAMALPDTTWAPCRPAYPPNTSKNPS